MVAFWSSGALANDVDLEVRTDVIVGQEKPALVLRVRRAIKSGQLKLQGGPGPMALKLPALRSGVVHEVALSPAVGQTSYEGELTVLFQDGGEGEMPLSFGVDVWEPVRIELPYERLELQENRVAFKVETAVRYCDHAIDFDGRESERGRLERRHIALGEWTELTWRGHDAQDVVLRIGLQCYAREGVLLGGHLVYPWFLEVPHEDVNFATGSFVIEPTERPKIDRVYFDIATAIRRYAEIIPIQLYVAGHTDTVGDGASNQTLSENRARAIARDLSRRGITVPIAFAGYGETELRVATADAVDMLENRRARYIIAVREPQGARWLPLK